MSIMSEMSRLGASMARAHRARATERALRHLPPELQEDIGVRISERAYSHADRFNAIWNAAR